MYETYLVTTGCREDWTSTETMEEAVEVQTEYSNEHPHEDVAIFMNIGDVF